MQSLIAFAHLHPFSVFTSPPLPCIVFGILPYYVYYPALGYND